MKPNLICLWFSLIAVTLVFALCQGRKLNYQTLALALAGATAFSLVALLFPSRGPRLSLLPALLRWPAYAGVFSLVFRFALRSGWRQSIGVGFFSATCLLLLQIFS